jgi:hypothetical protein
MEGDSLKRLIPLLIFGAVLAFNYVGPWLRRWLRQQQAAAAAAARNVPRPASAVAPTAARSARTSEVALHRASREQALQDMRDAAAQRRPRLLARELLSDRDSLRQAMVVSTILGPCRANRPHEPGA